MFYQKYDIEIPKVYEHIQRTGCCGCPYSYYRGDTEKELLLINDKQFEFVVKYFEESYKVRGIDIDYIRQMRNQTTIYDFIDK